MTETNDVTRIAFLPYQPSMWDSLASVYDAASADPQCDAIVVPLPYRSRGDGPRAPFRREAFPADLNLREWSLDELRAFAPDIIYIHNPYDALNTVTEIHPDFQSPSLATLGAVLVYIPYYLCVGTLPDNHDMLAAYPHVDVIISPSTVVAEQFAPAVRDKVLALGSPKVDAMVALRSRDHDLTDAAPRKKSVFVNTTIGTVLAAGPEVFARLVEIFEAAEAREDIEVVWRPHPLLGATIRSMRPHLGDMFAALKRAAQAGRNIRLDETPDMEATALSCDAYLGDRASSVVHLWGLTGKPIFLLRPDPLRALNRETTRVPWISDFTPTGETNPDTMADSVWFSHARMDLLGRLDLQSGLATVETGLGETPVSPLARASVVNAGDHIVLGPGWDATAAVVDTQTLAVTHQDFAVPPWIHHGAVRWRDQVVLMPGQVSQITFFDPTTGHIDTWSDWIHQFGLEPALIAQLRATYGWALDGDTLYLACSSHNAVFVLDLAQRTAWAETVGTSDDGWSSLTIRDGVVWLAGATTPTIVAWDPVSGDVREYEDLPGDFVAGHAPFRAICSVEDGLVLFPDTANLILHVEPESGSISVLDIGPSPDARARLREGFRWPHGSLVAAELGDGTALAQSAYDLSMLRVRSSVDWYRFIPRFAVPPEAPVSPVDRHFGHVDRNTPWACQEDGHDVTIASIFDYVVTGAHDTQAQDAAYGGAAGPVDGSVGVQVHQAVLERRRRTP